MRRLDKFNSKIELQIENRCEEPRESVKRSLKRIKARKQTNKDAKRAILFLLDVFRCEYADEGLKTELGLLVLRIKNLKIEMKAVKLELKTHGKKGSKDDHKNKTRRR